VVQGERLNNLRIVRPLAESGEAVLYEAQQPASQRSLALKLFKLGPRASAYSVEALLEELRAVSALAHPNVVEICDLGRSSEGAPFVVMELLEGENLSVRLARMGRLPWPAALEIAQQTARALDAAHESGVIHRALEPRSLFLARDPHLPEREVVKVLDFGVARLRGETCAPESSAGLAMRALLYLSPEQRRGANEPVDRRADIYALGAILYEALSGRPPFVSETAGDLMLQHMNAAPPALPSDIDSLPAGVEAAIQRALAKEPGARFASMAAFSAAFGYPLPRISFPGPELAGDAVSVSQSPLRPPAELRSGARRPEGIPRRALWFGLGAAAVLLLALVLAAGTRRAPELAPASRAAGPGRSERPLAARLAHDAGWSTLAAPAAAELEQTPPSAGN
jgi:serine/threonine-protein kinase